MKMLQKEWNRTGAAKASVIFSAAEAEEAGRAVLKRVDQQLQEAEKKAVSFRKCAALCHKNYILLRLVKKIKTERDRADTSGAGCRFLVALDKEELKLYRELFDHAA